MKRLLWAALALPLVAQAQTFPARAIHLVAPYAAGGAMDLTARSLAAVMSESIGQQVVVENRPGASGLLGTEVAARAAPDGYTLLMYVDTNTIFPVDGEAARARSGRELRADHADRAGSHVVVAHPSLPASNLQELIVLREANPGTLSYASPGTGSPQHLAGETIKQPTGIDITHIPYKGGGQAIGDVVGGQVKLGVLGMAPVMPHYKAGKLKILAVTGGQALAAAARGRRPSPNRGCRDSRRCNGRASSRRPVRPPSDRPRRIRALRTILQQPASRREDRGARPGSGPARRPRPFTDDPRRDQALAGGRQRRRRQAE